MSLVARALEQAGIATVVIGSARDIVEHCGIPRYLFTDFPLGNPCGRPYDETSQHAIMTQAMTLLKDTKKPGKTVVTPFVWDDDGQWKDNYMHVGPDNIAALRAAGDRRKAEQSAAKERREASAG